MTSTVGVSVTPIPDLGNVVLTITVSGDPVSAVSVLRRNVGETELMAVNPPADGNDGAGGVLLVGGSATVVDSCAPLGVPFEYLTSVSGAAPTLSSIPVTLVTGTTWWLGCPARPSLNVRMPKTLVSPPCSTAGSVVMVGMTDHTRAGKSTLVEVDGRADSLHSSKPMMLPAYTITLATRTLADLGKVSAILDPGEVLCLRAPGTSAYGFLIAYLSVRSATIMRISNDLRKEWRRITLEVVEILEPLGGVYGSSGAMFSDLCDVYSTFALAEAQGLSWSNMPWGQFGGTFPSVFRTGSELASEFATCTAVTATGHTCSEILGGL
jgi:hypothetical protein